MKRDFARNDNLVGMKSSIKKLPKSKTFIALLILFFPFIYLFGGYENKIFSFNFVDEEDNMMIGKYLLRGEKLFSDLYTNHQPATYILSAALQRITQPNSIQMLVKRHREFVIVWSLLWAIFLVFRFEPFMLLFITPYELSKHYLLGNIFLAETFVVYPCIYLTTLLYYEKRQLSNKELVFVGMNLAFLTFSLLPILPFIAGIILSLFFIKRASMRHLLFLLIGFSIILAVVAYFSSMNNYFRDSIYANFKYYIPTGGGAIGQTNITSFLTPIKYLLSPSTNSIHINLIKISSAIFLINIFLLIFVYRKFIFILLFLLLGLSNSRTFGVESMSFHLLPWYGLLFFAAVFTSKHLIDINKNVFNKMIFISFIILIIVTNFFYTKEYFLVKTDKNADVHINFSTPFDYGEAVRVMKNSGERMFATYDASLVYWQSGIDHAVPAVFYYPWMEEVPYIRKWVDDMFINNPPEFFIYQYAGREGIDKYMSGYRKVKKDDKPTELYILNKKYQTLTKQQFQDLDYYRFSF